MVHLAYMKSYDITNNIRPHLQVVTSHVLTLAALGNGQETNVWLFEAKKKLKYFSQDLAKRQWLLLCVYRLCTVVVCWCIGTWLNWTVIYSLPYVKKKKKKENLAITLWSYEPHSVTLFLTISS